MLRRLLRHYRGERRELSMLAAIGLVAAIAEAASLVALAPLLQAVAEGREQYSGDVGPLDIELPIEALAGVAAVLTVLTLILTLGATYASARIVSAFQLRRRLEFVDSFLHAQWEAQATGRGGRLIAYSLEFVNQSASGLRDLASLVRYASGLLVFVSGALIVSWPATAAIATVSGVVFLIQRPIRQRASRYSSDYLDCHVSIAEELSTLELSAREMNAYNVGNPAAQSFRRLSRRQRMLRIRGDVLGALPSPLFRTAGLLVIVALIASAAISATMEVAALGVVVLLLYRSLTYGQSLAAVHAKLVVLEPVLDQFEAEHSRYNRAARHNGGVEAEVGAAGNLSLRDVSYRYPGADSAAVKSASLDIRPGEVVGIVGPSGAGKSTLADLLVGLREPSTGSASLGDIPLKLISERSRAQSIALVPQSVSIIPGTVAENVEFYRSIDRARIEAAVDQVGLSGLIAELPQGLDTPIGSGSRAVSGGQAQRIGIARAVAGLTCFIVLDEPTSALDSGSEEAITELIGQLRGEVGIAVIAHRLSTLRYCDRVIVIEDGAVTGADSLPNLRRNNPYVKRAFELGSLSWPEPDEAASAPGTPTPSRQVAANASREPSTDALGTP